MSDQQGNRDSLVDDEAAFEFVSGLMRDEARRAFEQRLQVEPALRQQVELWEEQLSNLTDQRPLEARASTWTAIEKRVNAGATDKPTTNEWSLNPASWLMGLMGAALALAVVYLLPLQVPTSATTVDYVAVMTTPGQQPGLTTFGEAGTKQLTLHWQALEELAEDEDYQLWAVSKRDGQTRSIAILDNQSSTQLDLSDANWRLITDAHSLILTREEAGGSAIDEPSDLIVASGVCVRIPSKTEAG